MTVTIAGPMTNVVLMGLAGWLYFVMQFFNFQGSGSIWGFLLVFMQWFMYANAFLAAFNMIPIFPFDGGAMLRSFLVMRKGELHGTLSACWIGQIIAVFLALCGVVLAVRGESNGIVFVLLALFGFISCRREEHLAREGLVYEEQWDTGVRWSDAPIATDQGKGILERWREARALKQTEKLWAERRKEAERGACEERELRARVDVLLAKVKDQGLDALTPDERRELRDASEKFKRRNADNK
jgi:hypothetical protein